MLDFIVNPNAGGKKGKKMMKIIHQITTKLEKANVDYAIHITKELKSSRRKTEELIKNGATDIIAVGGDGTLHEVINGFSNFDKVNLGIIPCGTGNDFASAINLPKKPLKALEIILKGRAHYTDYIQMPTIRGLNVISTGIDVDVLKRYNSLKRKTKFGYTKCLIKTLCNFEYSDFTVEINGNKKPFRSFIAGVCNGYRFGGGIPICPIALVTDGELDFIAVKEIPKIKIIGAFLKLKAGKIFKLKQTQTEKVKKIKITSNKPLMVNVDGELYDDIPFEAEVVSNTLKVYR